MKRLISSCYWWCPQCLKPILNIAFPARQCLTCQRHLWSLRFLNMKTAGYLCPNLCWAICHQAHAFFIFCSSCSDGSHSICCYSKWAIKMSIFFIVSRGSFFFRCPQAEMPYGRQWSMTQSWLTNWPTNQWSADQFPQSCVWNSSDVQYWSMQRG